jgi:hypothetical protein
MPQELTELTAEVLRRTLESPKAGASQRGGREQRRAPRTRLAMRAALLPFSERLALETIDAPVQDLSRGGFGFLHDRQVPLGEQFALVLPEASGRPIVILCMVSYWQPLAENLYKIGARFCRVLREGEAGLPLLLEDPVSGEITEARNVG